MIGLMVRTQDTTKRVSDAADSGTFRSFSKAAFSISSDAKASLTTADGPSAPGQPPHTHRGEYLRKAVRYAADKEGAVIGPIASVVGDSGAAHEFGEEYRGQDYPERPFMAPALERATPRLADDWSGSVGE